MTVKFEAVVTAAGAIEPFKAFAMAMVLFQNISF
jgi:hypothetical protein